MDEKDKEKECGLPDNLLNNLSSVYYMEKQREELNAMAEKALANGDPLSSAELLRERQNLQKYLNHAILGRMLEELDEEKNTEKD